MNLNEYLKTCLISISQDQRPSVLALLADQTRRERACQGAADTELMKLLCLQLFGFGMVEDSITIWSAKTASMDADCSIDIQLLCGAGLDATRSFLAANPNPESTKALARIDRSIASGDFRGFSPETYFADLRQYFGL